AQAEYELFQDEVLDEARMSPEQYLEMFVRPQMARETINARIISEVPQSAPQVEVAHVLVGTEDLANQVYERVTTGGESFEEVAQSVSIDTVTAQTGGQLGWVTDQQLPDELTEAAFSAEPGTVVGPIETGYGWHVIKVIDKDDNRPLPATQYSMATEQARSQWLEQQRETY